MLLKLSNCNQRMTLFMSRSPWTNDMESVCWRLGRNTLWKGDGLRKCIVTYQSHSWVRYFQRATHSSWCVIALFHLEHRAYRAEHLTSFSWIVDDLLRHRSKNLKILSYPSMTRTLVSHTRHDHDLSGQLLPFNWLLPLESLQRIFHLRWKIRH